VYSPNNTTADQTFYGMDSTSWSYWVDNGSGGGDLKVKSK